MIDQLSRFYTYKDAKSDSNAGLIAYRYRRFKYLEARNIPIHDAAKSTIITFAAVLGIAALSAHAIAV
ncbi:MAG TPA: hypothetical protein VHY35_03715 [Stellaceae bacterium]|jgi:hypothetical protein|nr:hypothetical protein [Stellaceae bacterium]